jgi:protein-tyrosine-phosphatase
MNLETCVANMKVLFVCSGNAYRSPVAEALLKKLKPEIDVDSAGIYPPLIPISGDAREYLAKENALQYLKKVPEDLDSKQLDEYDLIIAMEPRHKGVVLLKRPECESKIVVWNIYDPYFAPDDCTEKIFEQIKRKVKKLADTL